jgi:hypothetical protein
VNQGEQAVSNVLQQFEPGGAMVSSTANDLVSANYKATALPTNSQGVPTALLVNDTAFAAYGSVANDIPGATSDVTMRYVIDRLCSAAGASSSTNCVQSIASPPGGTGIPVPGVPPPTAAVYRLSVRVTGPRNTQVFLQTTFTKPD